MWTFRRKICCACNSASQTMCLGIYDFRRLDLLKTFVKKITYLMFLHRYDMEKNQIIPEVRHHVKSVKKIKYNIPGFTHYLNEKNNEMCNKIFPL